MISVKHQILLALMEKRESMTTRDLMSATVRSRSTVSARLTELVAAGIVVRVYLGPKSVPAYVDLSTWRVRSMALQRDIQEIGKEFVRVFDGAVAGAVRMRAETITWRDRLVERWHICWHWLKTTLSPI